MLKYFKLFFWRKNKAVRIFLAFLVVLFFITLIIYNSLNQILEWSVEKLAQSKGFSAFEMRVEKVDPWELKINNLKEINGVSVNEIEARYDPAMLTLGKINSLSVSGLSADISLEDSNKKQTDGNFTYKKTYELLNNILTESPLNYFRLRDSSIEVKKEKIRALIKFAQLDFFKNQILLSIDGFVNNIKSFLKASISREGEQSFISSIIQFDDLSIIFNEALSHKKLSKFIPKKLEIKSGNLGIDSFARIGAKRLEDIFFELNATNLDFRYFDNNFSVPKLISFFDWDGGDEWSCNTYFNFEFQNLIQAKGFRIFSSPNEDHLLFGGEVSELITGKKYHNVYVQGLRFPTLNLRQSDFMKIPVNESKRFVFDKLHYEDSFFRVYDGAIDFTFLSSNKFRVSVPTLSANLIDLGISFNEFSYNGFIDLDDLPSILSPQTISGLELNIADQDKLTNLALTFRAIDESNLLIDMLTVSYNNTKIEFLPANIDLRIPKENPQSLSFEFNGTSLSLPDLNINFSGINGSISLNSVTPFETNGTQIIFFDECIYKEYVIKDGNFSFQITADGVLKIEDSYSKFLNGTLGLKESSMSINDEEIEIITFIDDMNGQSIIDLFDGLDAEINGNFSGKIPLSRKNGKWNFEEGFIEMDAGQNRTLKYDANGLLTKDYKAGTQEYNRMKMAEDALKNLSLDFLRISFNVLGESRKITGSVIGDSILADGKKVVLDYRPNTIAGLDEIIRYLNRNY